MKKKYRLLKSEDFKKVIQRQKFLSCPSFTFYFNKNELNHTQIGITIPTKIGHAFLRNKIRRQIRMMIDENFNFEKNVDIVIMVRQGYLTKSYEENSLLFSSIYKKWGE